MENNSTVKYSSKHRYGATKRSHKAKLAMTRSKSRNLIKNMIQTQQL